MYKCYVIQNEFYFYPVDRCIESTITGKRCTLHTPAALCLERLLERPGEISSQAELLEAGWGELAKHTSQATYYQCLTNIRKQFIAMGMSEKLIITVPRRGVQINPMLSITLREESAAAFIKKEECITPGTEPDLTSETEANQNKKVHYVFATALLISLLGILYALMTPESYFTRFTPLPIPNQCIYLQEDISDHEIEQSIRLLNQHQYTCQKHRNYYVQKRTQAPFVTFLSCEPVKKGCSSVIIMENIGGIYENN